jgi:hypothetical protein
MNEGNLEAWVMGQQVQAGVEDVVSLGPSEIIEEQMQASVDIGEIRAANVDIIVVDLEKNILMIE